MSLAWLVIVIAAVVIASAVVNIAVLWLCCKLWRVKDCRFGRVVTLALVLIAIQFMLYPFVLGMSGGSLFSMEDDTVNLLVLGASLAALGANWWAIKWVLETGLWRAGGILLTSSILGYVAALVIAFGLKATFVDAFVIPTGAMAPTLLGQHVDVTCPKCGREFAVGVSPFVVQSDGWPPFRGQALVGCLNCGEEEIAVGNRQLQSGDRILVDKTDRTPDRWQLAVFHPPLENLPYPSTIPGNPTYIFRVVGLPGEMIEILDGDLYVNGTILRKPPDGMDDLWLPVFDSKWTVEQSRKEYAWPDVWNQSLDWKKSQDGWEIQQSELDAVLDYDGPYWDVDSYEVHFDRYNTFAPPQRPVVRDWRVTIDAFEGEGGVGFAWSCPPSECTCIIRQDGRVVLTDTWPDIDALPESNASLQRPLQDGALLTFVVRDGESFLFDDEQLVASMEVAPARIESARAEREAATDAADRARLRLFVWEGRLSVSRVQLDRDVYFRTPAEMDGPPPPGVADAWHLADDEYFFLGDNSSNSSDSRYFGPVSQNDILGVARWCYLPRYRAREFP